MRVGFPFLLLLKFTPHPCPAGDWTQFPNDIRYPPDNISLVCLHIYPYVLELFFLYVTVSNTFTQFKNYNEAWLLWLPIRYLFNCNNHKSFEEPIADKCWACFSNCLLIKLGLRMLLTCYRNLQIYCDSYYLWVSRNIWLTY